MRKTEQELLIFSVARCSIAAKPEKPESDEKKGERT
jgi:hypothetical protein